MIIGLASEAIASYQGMTKNVTVKVTESFNQLKNPIANRFLGAKSWPSLLMGKIVWTVLKWRPL